MVETEREKREDEGSDDPCDGNWRRTVEEGGGQSSERVCSWWSQTYRGTVLVPPSLILPFNHSCSLPPTYLSKNYITMHFSLRSFIVRLLVTIFVGVSDGLYL